MVVIDTAALRDLFEEFERLPDLIAVRWKKEMRTFQVDWQRRMTRSIKGSNKPVVRKSPSDPLSSRRGAAGLKGSFTGRVMGSTLNDLEAQMFSTAGVVASVHEFGTKGAGGTLDPIRPKRAQFLTVPLPAALTKSGRPKQGLETVGDWIESKGAFFFDNGTNILVVIDEGDHGDIIPLFVLKKVVNIPPRLKMRETFESMLPKFSDSLDEAIGAALVDAVFQGKG